MVDFSFLREKLRIGGVVRSVSVVVLLQIVEQLTEQTFSCPCNEFRQWFAALYFATPAAVLVVLTAAAARCQKRILFNPCQCGRPCRSPCGSPCGRYCEDGSSLFNMIPKCLYPASCWIVILLIDGKYFACFAVSKCENGTVDINDAEGMKYQAESKVSGFAIVLIFAVSYFIYLMLLCCREPEKKYKHRYKKTQRKEREESVRKFAEERAKHEVRLIEEILYEQNKNESKETQNKPIHFSPEVVTRLLEYQILCTSETKFPLPCSYFLNLQLIRTNYKHCTLMLSLYLLTEQSPVNGQNPDSSQTLRLPLDQVLTPRVTLTLHTNPTVTLTFTSVTFNTDSTLTLSFKSSKRENCTIYKNTYILEITSDPEPQLKLTPTGKPVPAGVPTYSVTLPSPLAKTFLLIRNTDSSLTLILNPDSDTGQDDTEAHSPGTGGHTGGQRVSQQGGSTSDQRVSQSGGSTSDQRVNIQAQQCTSVLGKTLIER
nr:PREDICTED: uncharacterized protein LOC107076009 [Lepisosteus oculatus]